MYRKPDPDFLFVIRVSFDEYAEASTPAKLTKLVKDKLDEAAKAVTGTTVSDFFDVKEDKQSDD